jgi:hypothetical protein
VNVSPLNGFHASVAGVLLMLPLAGCGLGPDTALAEPAAQRSETSPQPPAGKAAAASDVSPDSKSKTATAAASRIATASSAEPRSTSNTPPPIRSFSSKAVPVRDFPRVASAGGCAPTYRNGTHGTCIAEKPCRGYGIRNGENQVLCMCYLKKGGCDHESRCDARAHECVADTKEPNYSE